MSANNIGRPKHFRVVSSNSKPPEKPQQSQQVQLTMEGMLRLWRMLRLVETAVTGRDWSLRIVAFAAKEQKYDGFHATVRHHCSSSDSSAGHH